MIRFININKIYPHPDNPRKDLGDISELAESVKASGILQNLTVVKQIESTTGEWIEGTYTVIIGHRRLAAAKLAGLEEVPCIISDMDHKTQIATMLLENMQRSDLTAYEQAQGFQMMLDLGESVNDISSKTGFSETTVRRRMKLLELDQDKFKESVERGGNLIDYMELSKIKDIDKRNEVLEHIGTDDFNWKLNGAINAERREEIKGALTEKLEKHATRIEHTDLSKMRYCDSITYDEDNLDYEIKFQENKKYYFMVGSWFIEIYEEVDNTETEEDVAKRKEGERKREKQREKDGKINEIKERTSQLRRDFVYSLSNTKVKSCMDEIVRLMLKTQANFYLWDNEYIKIFELETKEEDFDFKEIEKEILKRPELSLFKILYMVELDSSSYFDFRGRYYKDETLDDLYSILTKLGYKMSEEEKQLKDGTHELFKAQEEENYDR